MNDHSEAFKKFLAQNHPLVAGLNKPMRDKLRFAFVHGRMSAKQDCTHTWKREPGTLDTTYRCTNCGETA